MASAYIRIDLDDLSEDDLISELESRWMNEDDQLRLLKLVKDCHSNKIKFLLRVCERYSELELEEMFKERFDHSQVPKEQLSLPLNSYPNSYYGKETT